MRKLTLPSFIAFVSGENRQMKALKTFVLTFLLSTICATGFAQVTVLQATGGTNICSNFAIGGATPAPTPLTIIRVRESAGGFGEMAMGVDRVVINTPVGWQFNTGAVPLVNSPGGNDITNVSIFSFTSTTLTIDVTVGGTSFRDRFDIQGLEIQATSTAAPAGSLVASVAAGTVTGLPGANMGNLSLTTATTPGVVINASPSNTVCAGTLVTFTPTPSNAVTPTYNWFLNGVSQGIAPTFAYVPNSGDNVWAVMTSSGTCETNSTPTSNTVNMTVNIHPTASAAASPTALCEGATLSLNATPLTGTPPFSYTWSGPGSYVSAGVSTTRPSITTAGAGVYSVTVTDGNNCTSLTPGQTLPVTVNQNPTTTATALPASICVGQTLQLNATTPGVGTAPFNYQWSGPSYSSTGQSPVNSGITLAGAGTYTVVVTDANLCVGQAVSNNVTVNSNPTIFALATTNNICALNTLTLTSTPSGGLAPYNTFTWNSPDGFSAAGQNTTRANIPLTGGGIYSVTVTDANGCTGTGTTANVVVNANPTISAAASPNPICEGLTLNLNSTPAGGLLPYSFVWNGPSSYTAGIEDATRPSITTAGAGIYSVTVTDNNGCIGRAATLPVVVNTNPTISASTTPAVICVGQTLNMNSLVSGGTTPYASFVWNAPNGFSNTGQFSTYPAIPLNGGGVYSVTVTDNVGCIGTATTLPVTVHSNPTISATSNSAICVGNTLNLNSTPAGGSGTYVTYAWTGPNTFTASTQAASISSATTAATGNYSVTVTDNNGCSGTGGTSVVVNVNPTITVATATPASICVGQTLGLTATAGSGSNVYTSYSWTGPAGFTSVGPLPAASRPSVTTAHAGVYSVIVTDNNGCVSAPGTTSSVVVNTLPSITASATPNPLCAGATLALNSSPTGGSGSYTTYSWSGPSGFTATTQNTTRLNIAAGGAGVYSVNVTDNNGCTSAAPGTTLPVVVNALPTITVFANPNPICALRTLSLTATPAGGSGTYSSFLWNGPNSFTDVAQNTTVPGITSAGAGIYSVTVTDNNGCTSAIGTTATIIVRQNPTITATALPTPLCVGSTLNLTSTPAGGSGSYTTYSWSGPGGFTAAVQNTTNTNIQLTGAGVYSVNVTDNFGCTSVAPGTTASVVVNDNPTVTATASPLTLCQGSTLNLNSSPTGGGGIYSYAWNGPSAFTATTQNTTRTSIPVAGSGVYSVTVTDNNSCVGRATTGFVVVNPNPTITASALPNPICVGNTLNLTSTASSGSGVYTNYAWNGPGGFTSTGAASGAANASITTLGAGVYSVTVTDNNGCSGSGVTSTVVVNTNPTITASASPNPICSGRQLNLSSTPAGGSGTYSTFGWTGPNGFSAGTQNAANLAIAVAGAGVYSVTVTDNNGCSGSGTTLPVVVNASPSISATATPNPICVGNTLSLNSTPVAGTGAITGYSWTGPNSFTNTNQNTSIASVVLANAGVYSVTVTDNNSCNATATTASVVVNPLPLVFNVNGGGSYCSGGTGVSIGLDGSELGVNYELFYAGSPAGFQAGTGSPISFGLFTAAGGPYTVVATNPSTTCTQNMASSTSVTILPLPTQYNVTGGGSYCFGGTGVVVGLDGSDLGFTYQLYDGAATVGSPVAGTGNPISFGLQTTVTTYTVLATNNISLCTNGMIGSATVNTIALPTVYTVAGGGTLCEFGTGFHIGMSPASDFNVNYQLYNGSTPVGAPVAGTGGAIDFGIFTAAGTYSVLATSTTTGCSNGMAGSADIFVNPAPVQFNITGGGGYCLGGSGVNIGLTGSEVGIDYQLFNGSSTVGAPVPGTGSVLDFGPQLTAGTYSVSATNTTTLCNRDMGGSTVIVINPLPNVYDVTGGGNYCDGGTGVNIGLTGSDVGVSYQPVLGGFPIGLAATGTGAAPFTIGLETTAGTYSVVATNPVTGCTSNMNLDATVNIDPLPNVYGVVGGGTLCNGGAGFTVGLGNSDAGITYQLYNGSAATGAPVTSVGGAFDFGTFTTAGTYTVQAINTGTGCVNNMAGSADIIVNPLPASIGGATSVCTGSTITLTNASAGGTWTSSAPGIADIDPGTGVVTGMAFGTADITYTLPTGCQATASVAVNQTPGGITGINSVCVGAVSFLSNATLGGTWSNAASAISTVDPSTGAVTGVNAGFDVITYTVSNGCFVTINETVNALPVIPAISAATTAVCVNGTITYTDAQAGGTWSSDNLGVATVDPVTGVISGVSPGSANIIYTYTNGSGCTDAVAQGVTVNPLPGVSIVTGPTNVCEGASITLANGTPGGVWSSSNPGNATISNTGVVTGVAAGSTVIAYTVTNGAGCSSSSLYSVAVGSAMPTTAIVPVGSVSLCGGNPVTLNVVSTGSLTSYQWLLGGAPIIGANSSSYIATSAGLYEVIIGNGTCELQVPTGVNVVNPPNAVIQFDSVANLLYTGSFATYQWYYNGNIIFGANTGLLTPSGDGVYAVIVTDANGCADTGVFTMGLPVGVGTQNVAANIRIYPNPASSVLHIDAPGKVFVSVLSTDGKMLIERKEAVSINVSQLADGMYMIMVYDENNNLVKTGKFMKVQ